MLFRSLFTTQSLIQVLNNISNYDLFADIELAIQTKSEIYGHKTRLDEILQEEQAQLFEKLREDEEDVNNALLLLHTIEPDQRTKPKVLQDFRSVNLAGVPRTVLDIGSYLRSEPLQRRTDEEVQEKTLSDNIINIPIMARNELGNIVKTSIKIETVDMPFAIKIMQVINYASKVGFDAEALELGTILVQLANQDSNAPRGITTTSYAVKTLSMLYEVFGNPDAEQNVYLFVLNIGFAITSLQ